MDIRIGFTDGAREISVATDKNHDDVVRDITAAITNGDEIITLTDKKGAVIIARASRIAWVEVGAATTSHVGFTITQ